MPTFWRNRETGEEVEQKPNDGQDWDPVEYSQAELDAIDKQVAAADVGHAANVAARGDQPLRPTYQSIVDSAGNLREQYKLGAGPDFAKEVEEKLKGINLNTEALEALRKRGLSTEESPWLTQMLGLQKTEEATQRDLAERLGARQAADAYSQLAMRGGVSGGERERGALESGRNTILDLQDVARGGEKARFSLRGDEEKTKLGILSSLPGMELAALEPEMRKAEGWGKARASDIERGTMANQWNIGKAIEDIRGKSAFDLGNYTEQMKAWAAERQAKAQEASGK